MFAPMIFLKLLLLLYRKEAQAKFRINILVGLGLGWYVIKCSFQFPAGTKSKFNLEAVNAHPRAAGDSEESYSSRAGIANGP